MTLRILVALLLTLTLNGIDNAAAALSCPDRSNAQPARLVESDVQSRRINNLTSIWKGSEPFRFTWFSAYVDVDGHLDGVCCYSSTEKITNVEAGKLLPKLEKLRFAPAMHLGEHSRAYVNFTIIGVRTDSGFQSRLFLNQLRFKEEYGIDYLAPQRLGTFGRNLSVRLRAEYVVDVNAKGSPGNARISEWHMGPDSARERFLRYVGEECFIPGFVNGEPVDMEFYEVFQR